VARSVRLLALVLAATGCALEPPRPEPLTGALPAPAPALLPPPVISAFGDARSAGGGLRIWQHAGVDIRAATGTPALAAADGVVVRTGWGPLAGRFVILVHEAELATVYYHLSAIAVQVGQAVERGAMIGRTGATGNATSPHLHFGICRREGAACGASMDTGWADPARYWAAGTPCFVPGRAIPARPLRLTYPVPCAAA
jgi:murein DD-endopeptidase MepM/ murein hydrolase activator NlpD